MSSPSPPLHLKYLRPPVLPPTLSPPPCDSSNNKGLPLSTSERKVIHTVIFSPRCRCHQRHSLLEGTPELINLHVDPQVAHNLGVVRYVEVTAEVEFEQSGTTSTQVITLSDAGDGGESQRTPLNHRHRHHHFHYLPFLSH